MFIDVTQAEVYIRPGVTDMRKAINGLSAMIQDEMELDLFGKCVFLFCSKNRKNLKLIYWDENGFCLWQKKLQKEKFPWPKSKQSSRQISHEELKWLLSGIDFFHAHEKIFVNEV